VKINFEDYDQMTVMNLKGDMSGGEADRFRRSALERFDARVRDFVLDLETIEAIDSQGLESLLWLQDQASERLGQVRLAGCPDHVQTILEMTRLAGRFDTHQDVESAIKSLR